MEYIQKNQNKEENLSLSPKFNEAFAFAVRKHGSQVRKGTTIPYIVHLYEVAQILKSEHAPEEVIIAGVLHDTVEDTNTTLDEIAELFGENIAEIIGVESEDKSLPYIERKAEHMARVAASSRKAKMVNCADKLSNLRGIYLDSLYDKNIWNRFNGTKVEIQWYYCTALEALSALKGTNMYKELKGYYDTLFNNEKVVRLGDKVISSCTDCPQLKMELHTGPNDWFNGDDLDYICSINQKVLSESRSRCSYEKQRIPDDCPRLGR